MNRNRTTVLGIALATLLGVTACTAGSPPPVAGPAVGGSVTDSSSTTNSSSSSTSTQESATGSTAGSGSASGSGTPDQASGSGSAAVMQTQHRGGTLRMLWLSAGSSIDTAVDYDPNWFVLRMTADGLMAWKQVGGKAGNDLVPDLAEALPTLTNGGKTYLFKIRSGIKFSTSGEVKPSDIAYTFLRQFKIPGPGVGMYSAVVGAAACIKTPASCDLSKGVVADDAARTVTINLTAPDPDLLQKLALPFVYVVPKGTPNVDTGTKPLPATGPYMISKYEPNRSLEFVRNPNFKQWSADAQPDGYPDAISMKIGVSDEDAVTQVENNQADWAYDPPPADRLNEIATKFANQIHIDSAPITYFMAMNTKVAPFDNADVRRAVNFATDRAAVVQLFGGPKLAVPTCQILPPDFPGYQPNCPYTADPGTKWSAPDLTKAQQLVDASGTKGQKIVIVGSADDTTKAVSLYFVSLLNQLGYQASLKTLASSVEYSYVQDSRNKVQMTYSYWSPDYNAASNYLNISVGCSGFNAASTASPNLSGFCDPKIQADTEKALSLQQKDPEGANQLWAQIDKAVTDQSPQVSLFNSNRLNFVSSRVGNFQFSPAVTGYFLINQAWVQ